MKRCACGHPDWEHIARSGPCFHRVALELCPCAKHCLPMVRKAASASEFTVVAFGPSAYGPKSKKRAIGAAANGWNW